VENKGDISLNSTALEPGVFSAYGNGWNKLWKYFLELFLVGVIGYIISIPVGMFSWSGYATIYSPVFGVIGFAYNILISGPAWYGVSFVYLKAAREDKLEIKDILKVLENYWNVVLAGLLVTVIVAIGFFLLIIPGIIFACKLAFTPYLVVEWKMDAIAAVQESWRMTNGHSWKVFLIYLLGIPICIAGLICFGVGIIISIMWISLALASLYHSVSMSAPVSAQGPVQ